MAVPSRYPGEVLELAKYKPKYFPTTSPCSSAKFPQTEPSGLQNLRSMSSPWHARRRSKVLQNFRYLEQP